MKIGSLLAAVLLVVGPASIAVAQGLPVPEKRLSRTGEARKHDKKATLKSVAGAVKSTTRESVVVAGKDKGKDAEWTFGLDAKTTIKKGGKTIAPVDLKVGDLVTIRYVEQDGQAMARSISVREARSAETK